MTRSIRWGVLVLVLAAVATVALLVLGVRQSMGAECEVCVTFLGRTECRRAAGKDEREATTTATQNACAFLAGGMTQSIQCGNTVPDSVVCE